MSAMMRISSQVWPVWLPRAVARAEKRIVATNLQPSLFNQPLPPLLFSAAFQSLLSLPVVAVPANCAVYPRSKLPQLKSCQQLRTFSSSQNLPRRQHQQTRTFSNSPTSPPPIQAEHDPTTTPPPTWVPTPDVRNRPVTILGAGVLGRRLATIWASTSRPVNLYDVSPSALKSATTYIADTLSTYCSEQFTHPGHVHFTTDIHDAVKGAWMVIEAVPEEMETKISLLGRLDRICGRDTIIATNSASFRSGELVSEVKNRERVLNTLYYIPPDNKCVELMSCGYTSPDIFPFLVSQMREIGLNPMIVGNESTGLIFPRIFAAMKRESLMVLSEGIAQPEQVDGLFRDFFGADKGICEKMDEVGLDTVAKTERHFLAENEGDGMWEENEQELWKRAEYLKWLEEEYVQRGRLGEKSGDGLLVRKKENDRGVKHETPGQEVWKEHSVDLSGM